MKSKEPELQLRLFGGPELLKGGERVGLSPQQGAFLGVLFGSPRPPLLREEVLAIFWPDDDPTKARKRLNQLLYSIKDKTGGLAPFETEGDGLLPASALVRCDLVQFRAALEAGELNTCSGLLKDGLLKETPASLGRDLQDWIDARTSELRTELRRRGEALWQQGSRKGDWRLALRGAETLLSLSPLDEARLRKVMEAMAKAGIPEGSETAAEEFGHRILEADGSEWVPEKETELLLEKIKSVDVVHLTPPLGQGNNSFPEPPLLGRDKERDLLRRSLRRPPMETLRAILVTGEAGIGKTRLIQEALTGIPMEGQEVFTAGSAEMEQLIPLNPLIEALSARKVAEVLRELDEPWRAVLYGVMPGHYLDEGPIPEAPQIQPGSVPRRLFEAFHQLLLALTEGDPAILVLEDLQWADQTTLSVLEFLIRRWDHGALQLVISVRSEEIRRNKELGQFLDVVRVHDDFLEIPLGDLAPLPAGALIQELSPEPFSDNDVAYLRSLAGGNPFFLIELTLEFLAGRVEPGVPDPDVLTIPLSIRQVLQRRRAQLSEDAERILEALAVHTRPLDIRGLARVARVSGSRCLTALDQLLGFRLVTSDVSNVVTRHELIRQAVYQSLSDPRKALLHERVARHILRRGGRLPTDELAVHFHRAGVADEARKYAVQAANKAEASGAIAEALRFLRIAREHSTDPHEVAKLIGQMGHLNYLHQNLEEAAPLLELAAPRLRRQGEVEAAMRAEVELVDSLNQIAMVPWEDSQEELRRLKHEAKDRGCWEIFQDALDVEAHQLDRLGDLEGIREVLQEADRFSEKGGPKARCKAKAMEALNIYFGSPDRSLPAAREAVRIARTTTDNYLNLHALNRLIVVLHYLARLHSPEGLDALAEAERRLVTCGDLILKFRIRLNRAVWYLETGELSKAGPAFQATRKVIQGTKAIEAKAKLQLNMGELDLFNHDIPNARRGFNRASEFITERSPHFFRAFLAAGLGLCALHDGDLTEARERENDLPSIPDFWTFDPTLFITFKARMLRMRGDFQGVENLLDSVRADVEGRFLATWLRLTLEEARILGRANKEKAAALRAEGLEISEELGLPRLNREFRSLRTNG